MRRSLQGGIGQPTPHHEEHEDYEGSISSIDKNLFVSFVVKRA
jgi:hypothetical protein